MPTVLAFLGASIIRIVHLDHINWFLHFLNHICQSLSKILMFKPRWPTGSARDRSTPGDQLVFTIKCPSNLLNVFHNVVSFFWCLEKLWCCVCVRTWWDIWGTQCHFMGGGSGESTDFLSGSFSVFCNNWLTNLEHNLKREWYGRYFPNGEFNRPLNPNWEIHL